MLKRLRNSFNEMWVNELIHAIESEYADAFDRSGARFQIHSIDRARVRTVRHVVAPSLYPYDVRDLLTIAGDFESELEVARRKRFSSNWRFCVDQAEAEAWLRNEAKAYLAQFKEMVPDREGVVVPRKYRARY
jgi:hypothetical protein